MPPLNEQRLPPLSQVVELDFRPVQAQVDTLEATFERIALHSGVFVQNLRESGVLAANLSGILSPQAAVSGGGPFPPSPLAGGGGFDGDLDLGAGTLAARTGSGILGGSVGSLIGAATGPLAPFIVGGGIAASGYGDEVVELGVKIGAGIIEGAVRNVDDLAIAFVTSVGRELKDAGGGGQFGELLRGVGAGGSVLYDSYQTGKRAVQSVSDFLVPPAGASEIDYDDLREGFNIEERYANPPDDAGYVPPGIPIPSAFAPSSSGARGLARGLHRFQPGALAGAYDFFSRAGDAGREFQGIGDDSTAGRLYGRLGRSLEQDAATGTDIAGQGQGLALEGIESLDFFDQLEERSQIAQLQLDGLEQGLQSIGAAGGDSLRGLISGTAGWGEALGNVAKRLSDVAIELTAIQPFENFLSNIIGAGVQRINQYVSGNPTSGAGDSPTFEQTNDIVSQAVQQNNYVNNRNASRYAG